ncbi:MAG: hypothetical protein HW387_536 [Parachlamydiales bacterium]|nr:hypothetical protein [Parachlamydiales bacterium]
MKRHPQAGKPATKDQIIDVSRMVAAYYEQIPDPAVPEQRVIFGTSGHRGSSFHTAFNERHICAIVQAICEYRQSQGIGGPLFMGLDTHALSMPAYMSAIEVLAANGVSVILAENDEYTPTPVISHAILTHNRGRQVLADGIVITPSHNPPDEGGIKYDPPHGGGAETAVTGWIEERANELMGSDWGKVRRLAYETAKHAMSRIDFIRPYVEDLGHLIDMEILRQTQISIGIDPLGGAGVHYWEPIARRYGLNLTVVNQTIDPTFRFMSVDWDGKIRMDPSSSYAMQSLIGLKDRFAIAAACDTDHDRHGIVTKSAGLLPPNHYLCAAIDYLFQHRPQWKKSSAIGKTVVSSQMIDRVAAKLNRKIYEVPVGFKWFVPGLFDGSLAFAGEQSAGATLARMDGSVWTTDKDGIAMALLAAEMTARCKKDPGEIFRQLTSELGCAFSGSIEAKASKRQKEILKKLSPALIVDSELAGEKIESILTHAPGNGAPIGGVKVIAKNGWFAARPSGTEDIYKIYAESFVGKDHLQRILDEAQSVVSTALGKT